VNESNILSVDGRLVTSTELDHHPGSSPSDQVMLFRSDESWTLLALECDERWDAAGAMAGASVRVWSECVPDLASLENEARIRWGESGWVSLLEAGHDQDRELHAAWVPLRIEAELWSASLVDDDLARTTAYFGGRPLAAPARDNPEWRDLALQSMIAHLEELGWELSLDCPDVLPAAADVGNPVAGGLYARRYGYETAVIVRVDACGEIYARMADTEEIRGEPFRPIATDDRRHSWSEGQGGQPRAVGREFAEGVTSIDRQTWQGDGHHRRSDLGWDRGAEYEGLGR
jgi:hypothetical protein